MERRQKQCRFTYRYNEEKEQKLCWLLTNFNINHKTDLLDKLIEKAFFEFGNNKKELNKSNTMQATVYPLLIKEFKKQGTNLNQIARHCNEQREVSDFILDELSQIKNAYLSILSEIKRR